MASKKAQSDKSAAREVERILREFGVGEEANPPRQLRHTASGTDFGPAPRALAAPFGFEAAALGGEAPRPAPPPAPEPVFDDEARDDIQGNVIPGFNKDHQHFLFFRVGRKAPAKKWLRWLAPYISSMDEVLAFNRMYRELRFRLASKDVPVKATWVNVAFSCRGVAALLSRDACAEFGEESFRQGLAARSEYLGDPAASSAAGNRRGWVVGGPKNEADVLVIVASDDPRLLAETVARVKDKAREYSLQLLFEQAGQTLPPPLRGHEHFGFKDGVSQPGVRGLASPAPGDFITPRFIDPSDPRSRLFAKPGQALVWPGQFILGESRQNPEDLFDPVPAAANFPKWARRGSYLVCRRLRQDVRAFWTFAAEAAARAGLPATKFAAMLVGRWPSGAPVMRVPTADDPLLGTDDLANNHFIFDDHTRPSTLRPIPGYPGDSFPQARADLLGLVCPHFAHVRKANPRDSATDLGKTADSLIRLILRRGIPFGPPVTGVKKPSPALWKRERGLVFISYQTAIEDQFEFLTRRWANSPVQPNAGGHDLIIGQTERRGDRRRFVEFPTTAGPVRIEAAREWIIPTGGGYFFAPPIRALTEVLAA
jgi:Dyp-type peroxidase family